MLPAAELLNVFATAGEDRAGGGIGEDAGDIYVMSTEDGVDWRSKIKTGEQTLKSIKLTGGHKLAATFQGKDSDNIYALMSRDGVDF